MLKAFLIAAMVITLPACSIFAQKKQPVSIFVDAYSTIKLTRHACGLSADDGKIQSSQSTAGREYTIIGTDSAGYINGEWTVSCATVAAGETAPCKITVARMRPAAASSLSCYEISNYTMK